MKRRVINILNNKGQRRTFKFLSDVDLGIIIYSEDRPSTKKEETIDGGMFISKLEYTDGPVIQTGNYISFKNKGKYKVLSIHKTDYESKPNCYYLDTLKLDYNG